MRILHLDAGKELRGGQWQVLRLMEGLAAKGIESTLLARAEFPLFQTARKQGWRVEPLNLTRVLGMVRQHDLLHAHDAHAHTLGALIRRRPLVVSRRVAFPIGTHHFSSRWKYGRPACYLAVSEYVKSILVQGGVAPDRISVVYDGVPVLEQASGKAILALQKETTLATEAAALAGVPVRIAQDLERDLGTAAVLVYITNSEGLGSGALLAMSAGVAVIASKIGGLREVIDHRRTGLLVENTPESIAGALRQLAASPELARSLGHAARRTVMERFTVDRMVLRTMEAYRKVLG